MARMLGRERFVEQGATGSDETTRALARIARPLEGADDLDPLLARVGDARYVLLGEASHGTHEFYAWRSEITRMLVREKGFRFVAVEGDWPDCERVNRYVKGRPGAGSSAREVLRAFERWPTWMWANEEIVRLAEWLRDENAGRPEEQKAGFFGLDVYSLWESMQAVVAYLERVDPTAARAARRAYECFAPYGDEPQEYARATLLVPTSCEDEVVHMLNDLRRHAPSYAEDSAEAFFAAEQNALVVRNGELYYRTMVRGGAASWNVRDLHMVETLERLMAFHGPDAKAIVWEHNTHVGDARFTDMAESGELNVGQVVRQHHARDEVVLVGFSTHHGSVIAGEEWGAPMEVMRVPAARRYSYDELLHDARAGEDLLVIAPDEPDLPPELLDARGHRAIGVVYRPVFERYGNYVPTVLLRRYDAVLFVDETRALSPLHMPARREAELPETYPTGL